MYFLIKRIVAVAVLLVLQSASLYAGFEDGEGYLEVADNFSFVEMTIKSLSQEIGLAAASATPAISGSKPAWVEGSEAPRNDLHSLIQELRPLLMSGAGNSVFSARAKAKSFEERVFESQSQLLEQRVKSLELFSTK